MKEERSYVFDLLKNEHFVRWVQFPTEESNHYWSNWIANHESYKQDISIARRIIQSGSLKRNETLSEAAYDHMLDNIMAHARVGFAENHRQPSTSWKQYSLSAAACVLLLILGYISYLTSFQQSQQIEHTALITKKADLGQKLTVQMNDGTTIKLNSGSTLTYDPVKYSQTREVAVKGEAYFDVAKNEENPFTVNVEGYLRVVVLGTKFNINTHDFANLKTVTLAEGKVAVRSYQSEKESASEEFYLNPGMQAKFDVAQNAISIKEVDLSEFLSWKDGTLVFNRTPLASVFHKLSYWYGVEFQFDGNLLDGDCVLDGKFDNKPLAAVLTSISKIYKFQYDMNDRVVKIRGETCN